MIASYEEPEAPPVQTGAGFDIVPVGAGFVASGRRSYRRIRKRRRLLSNPVRLAILGIAGGIVGIVLGIVIASAIKGESHDRVLRDVAAKIGVRF